MRVHKILFDKNFERIFEKYKKTLSTKERDNLTNKLLILKENVFDSRLKTHTLQGGLKGYYSFSINYKDRLKFKIVEDGVLFFYDIGSHDRLYM